MGNKLAQVKKLTMAQLRNLENVAYTTDKVSDVTDLLKKLIGRDAQGDGWGSGVGQDLLSTLTWLRGEADRIATEVQPDYRQTEPDLSRQMHLTLIREYIKHMAAHFVYQYRLRGEETE